jgi:hypothetical protein
MRNVEVKKQADADPTQLQVRQKLGDVNWQKFLYRFDLNHHNFFNAHVHSVCRVNFDVVVHDRQGELGFNEQSGFFQVVSETPVVRTFKQSRPESGMHFECASDNDLRNIIYFHPSLPFLCVLCGKGRA